MARKAVAATLASVLLFTALVVADSTIMTAEDNLLSGAQVSHVESRELLLGRALAGSSSLQVLAQVQGYLASHAADCSSMQQYLNSISVRYSTSGEDSGILFTANASGVRAPPGAPQQTEDNLTLDAPFSGYATGDLNILTLVHVDEAGGGGAVLRQKGEAHILHIPIHPDAASSLCASALASLETALSRSSCNATLAQAAFDTILPSLVRQAASLGFSLTAGWGGGCPSSYWVTLVEPGVGGVTGDFDWTVHGAGTA